MREIRNRKTDWAGKHIYCSYSYLSCDIIFFRASAEKGTAKDYFLCCFEGSRTIKQRSTDSGT
jgi:hypothetical protein